MRVRFVKIVPDGIEQFYSYDYASNRHALAAMQRRGIWPIKEIKKFSDGMIYGCDAHPDIEVWVHDEIRRF